MKIHLILAILMVFGGLPAGSVSHADDLDDYIKSITATNLDFVEFDGVVMENDPLLKRLVVLEKTILLVDEKIGDYRLETMTRNRFGKTITPIFLQKGSRVFVRGIDTTGGSILAREIYEIGPGSHGDQYRQSVPEWLPGKSQEAASGKRQ